MRIGNIFSERISYMIISRVLFGQKIFFSHGDNPSVYSLMAIFQLLNNYFMVYVSGWPDPNMAGTLRELRKAREITSQRRVILLDRATFPSV
jgi:hypothetical protein